MDAIIVRFLAKEATQEESALLQAWMEESHENKKYFEQISFINHKAEASQKIIRVDVDAAWEKLSRRIESNTQQNSADTSAKKSIQTKVVPLIPLWLKVAAMLVFVSTITWLLREQWDISKPVPAGYVEQFSKDSLLTQSLADNSVVTLNRKSSIKYSENFGVTDRKIALQGEAFFQVETHDDMPFVVEAQETYIRQLGTSFNVKAFDADTVVEVFVKSGSLRFFTKEMEGIDLVAGETGVFNRNTRSFSKFVINQNNITAYINRVFVFHNAPLREVVKRLGSVYLIDFEIPSELAGNLSITVSFENEDLDMILDIIAETLNLAWWKSPDGKIILQQEMD